MHFTVRAIAKFWMGSGESSAGTLRVFKSAEIGDIGAISPFRKKIDDL